MARDLAQRGSPVLLLVTPSWRSTPGYPASSFQPVNNDAAGATRWLERRRNRSLLVEACSRRSRPAIPSIDLRDLFDGHVAHAPAVLGTPDQLAQAVVVGASVSIALGPRTARPGVRSRPRESGPGMVAGVPDIRTGKYGRLWEGAGLPLWRGALARLSERDADPPLRAHPAGGGTLRKSARSSRGSRGSSALGRAATACWGFGRVRRGRAPE